MKVWGSKEIDHAKGVVPLSLKDCAHAAQLHQAAFYRGWTEKDFEDFLEDPLIFGLKIQQDELFTSRYSSTQDCDPELVLDPTRKNKFGMIAKSEKTFCGYILWREIENEAEILTMVISPPLQRKGIGNLLLIALFERLKEKGISKLFLEVAEDNNMAKSFYINNGFVFLGKRQHYYKRPENKFVDALNFVKVISKDSDPFPIVPASN